MRTMAYTTPNEPGFGTTSGVSPPSHRRAPPGHEREGAEQAADLRPDRDRRRRPERDAPVGAAAHGDGAGLGGDDDVGEYPGEEQEDRDRAGGEGPAAGQGREEQA